MNAPTSHVTAYGFFGMGNIGNEASLESFLRYARRAVPDARLSCLCADPHVVRDEHRLPAARLMSYVAHPGRNGFRVKATKAVSRVWDVPRTFRLTACTDALVVPGTGVLETRLMAGPWGMPYWLFVAVLAARVRGRRVALVSVGAERAENPLTRALHRGVVRMSTYCSFRDEESRAAMGLGPEDAPVYPDLAFGLPVPPARPERAGHVVIGVMAFEGGPDRADRGTGLVDGYAASMAHVVAELVDGGGSVTLVVGDLADLSLAERIAAEVRRTHPTLPSDRLVVSPATTLETLMMEMSAAEVVVASRFHNVLCALMLCRPTVSLGYAEKNQRLLQDFGLGRFSQRLDDFDVDLLLRHIEEARGERPAVEATMKESLHRIEERLEEQFRVLDAEVFADGRG